MKKVFITLYIFTILATGSLSYAVPVFAQSSPPPLDYKGFVDCDGVIRDKNIEGDRQKVCDFNALLGTINKLINWAFAISVPVATVLFAYAGLLLMNGKPGDRTKAKDIFTNVAIGFIIMLVAWVSVRTVVDWFVKPDSGATTFLGK